MKLIFAWVTLVVTFLVFVMLFWPASGIVIGAAAVVTGFFWSFLTLIDYYFHGIGKKDSKS